jgi:polar amino acid transport system substrate-binding protein
VLLAPIHWHLHTSSSRKRSCSALFFLLLICGLLLISCNGTITPSAGTTTPATAATTVTPLPDLITPGVLTVGSYTDYLPQAYIDSRTQKVVGFDIDLIHAIARHMKLDVEIVYSDYSSLIDRLTERRYDVAIAAIPINVELEERVSFVPYFKGGEALLVEKGNPLGLSHLEDLCGLSIGVKTDTLEHNDLLIESNTCREHNKPPIQILASLEEEGVMQLFLAKRIVAAYLDAPLADYFIMQNTNRFEIGGSINNTTMQGIAIPRSDEKLFKAVQMAFQTLQRDGTYHALIVKWGLLHGELPVKTEEKE